MLQTGEIFIILVLALIVLGPRRLPEMARKIGQWTAELRNAAREITKGLEAEVSDFKEAGNEIREVGRDLRKPIDEVKGGMDWKGPKPLSGPTPDDAMRDYEEIQSNLDGGEEE